MNPVPRPRRGFTIVELTVVVCLTAVLAAILFPVFTQATKAAQKSSCQEHLYQVGLALQLYARDYDGRLPARNDDLGPLVGGYLRDITALECPLDPLAPQVRAANARREAGETGAVWSSYRYRGGLSLEERPDVPLAADWELWHQDAGAVLHLGGHVKQYNRQVWIPVHSGVRPLPPGADPRWSDAFKPTGQVFDGGWE